MAGPGPTLEPWRSCGWRSARSTRSSVTSQGNTKRVLAALEEAEGAGCDLAVFPELALTGYPPEDLLLKPSFVAENRRALDEVAGHTGSCAAVVGFVDAGRDLFNAAAVCAHGRVAGIYRKQHLPNYAVFDEQRYFAPRRSASPLFVIGGVRVGVSICEDAWDPGGPLAEQAAGGAELLVSINASPYYAGRLAERERMLGTRAADASCPLVYVCQVGGQDELVFDGASMVMDATGQLVTRAPQFEESTLVLDVLVEPVFRKRMLDPRGRPEERLLGVVEVTGEPDAARGPIPPTRARPGARARDRGVRGPGARHPRLRHQERLHRRGHRALRGHRLVPRGPDRGRRPRPGPRARGVDALALLQRRVQGRRRRAGRSPRHRLPDDPHRAGPRRPALHARPLPRRAAPQPDRGEPPEPHPGRDPHGPVERVRLDGAHDRQQERDGRRLLDPVRRHGRRLRRHQGRAEDARLRAVP